MPEENRFCVALSAGQGFYFSEGESTAFRVRAALKLAVGVPGGTGRRVEGELWAAFFRACVSANFLADTPRDTEKSHQVRFRPK